MARKFDRKLILSDGSEYPGWGFGCKKDAVAELVFNTSMAGYQEIISDPSYTDQAVVMEKGRIVRQGASADLLASPQVLEEVLGV